MLHSIYSRVGTDYAPTVVRITALVIILAYIFDYFRRKGAAEIMRSLRDAGAVNPESAVGMKAFKSPRFASVLLKEGAPLRRAVSAVSDRIEDGGTEAEESGKRKRKAKPVRRDVSSLRFYIPEREDGSPELPMVLRDGGETSVFRLIVGVVLAVVAAELIVFFFPQLKALLTSPRDMFN